MMLLEETKQLHHPRLVLAEVNVAAVMVEAKVDENGDPAGPALKHHGHPCLAKIRIVPPKERVQGLADAEITLDGDRWPLLSRDEQVAVLDHELTHLELVGEADDGGRPKLRMRLHDYEAGWFVEVAERHREASQERQQAATMFTAHGQALFPFASVSEATVSAVKGHEA